MTDVPHKLVPKRVDQLSRDSEPLEQDAIQTAPFDVNEIPDVPTTIGRYRVLTQIGSGGFGLVFRAFDDQLRRDVAIKVLIRADGTESLLSEARLLAQLDHPAIVPVFDVGRDSGGHVFIVSKFVDGKDLASLIRHDRPDHRRSAELIVRMADALEYAHRKGIFHRDVKPANILVSSDGTPVLADFGLAMRDSDFGRGIKFAGTPAYMSPEQARHEGHRVDGRSDIYSLGTVMYELLTGSRPFHASTVDELLDCVRNVEVRPPRQIDPHVPRELERICLRALAKRASERYSTAGDLAEDIRHWMRTVTMVSQGAALSQVDAPARSDSGKSDRSAVVIVPRGLRPFEATDSEFFLHLLPGPRDRNGIPESVRFWKGRIEETESDSVFRVGLLLGPSGSGKSSLVRAGVIPLLEERIVSIFVEARSEDLETRLIERIHRRIPATLEAKTLHDCLTLVRQRRGLPSGRKLLIVIDQFEQWLNLHDPRTSSELVESLRQCDGITLQTLLLVRDDFTLAATRFMEALEEPLLQNRNFATVDLFGIEHARRVLAAFGRSFGMISDPPTRDQQKFLETAVNDLAQDGHVVAVRLAIFAEMVKDKPWTPGTLDQFGGMQGIGVAFLEDRLAGPNAHPYLKSNLPLVKSLLQKLLPEGESEIKGRAKTRQELLSVRTEFHPVDHVDKILSLLDTETRLITPTGSDGTESVSSDSAVRAPTYQLSHDYLVPALRKWLWADERATRGGRARLRLRELAELWHRKQESRQLPTWFEWLMIRLFTDPRRWNDAERAMMSTAAGRLRMISLASIIFAAFLMAIGHEVFSWWNARMLTERLLNADTSDVSGILAEIDHNARWARPMLRDWSTASEKSPATSPTERDRRRQLHVALALSSADKKQVETVLSMLPSVPAEHLSSIRDRLLSNNRQLQEQLWALLDEASTQQRSDFLPLAALLAGHNPEPARWERHLNELALKLAMTRSSQIKVWGELFEQLADLLAPKILDLYRTRARLDEPARSNLVELVTLYSNNKVPFLAGAIEFATISEIPVLLEPAASDTLAMRTELRTRLQSSAAASLAALQPPTGELKQIVERLGGFLDSDCCWIPAATGAEFKEVAAQLTEYGLAPVSLRWHLTSDMPRLAVVFQRNAETWDVQWNLPADEARKHAADRQAAGWELVDFSIVESEEPARWTLLWRKSNSPSESRIVIDSPLPEHRPLSDELPEAGFILQKYDVRLPGQSAPSVTAVWKKESTEDTEAYDGWRYRFAAGDRYPSDVQTDIRSHAISLESSDRLGFYEDYLSNYLAARRSAAATTERGTAALNAADNATITAASYLSQMGDYEKAQRLLDPLAQRRKNSLRVHEQLAWLYARKGNIEALREVVDSLPDLEKKAKSELPKPGLLTHFKLRLAILSNESSEVIKLLDEHAKGYRDSPLQMELHIRALGVANGYTQSPETASSAMQALLDLIKKPEIIAALGDPERIILSVDFTAPRSDARFQQLLRTLGFERRFHIAGYESPKLQSKQLLAISPQHHQRESVRLRKDGYLPVAMDVASDAASTDLLCSSAWQREVTPARELAGRANRKANLILALAKLNELDVVFEGLSGTWGRDVRSQLIVDAPRVLPPDALVAKLLNEPALSSELQRSLLLTIGAYSQDRFSAQVRENLELRVAGWTRTENAGVRGAAEWCMRQWGKPGDAKSERPESEPAKKWFRNALGQVMVILQPPERFLMGSPNWEESRSPDERLHWAKIGRDYAVASTEVTEQQFQQFLADPEVAPFYVGRNVRPLLRFAPDTSCPRLSVERIDAYRFCQWLNKKEGVSEDEFCYPDAWKAKGDDLPLPKDYLKRTGYRLLTEMEWEYAARAGSDDPFHFGNDEALLSDFEWTSRNSDARSHPVATLRPNDFGLFDMSGNAFELCDGIGEAYLVPSYTWIRPDREHLERSSRRVVRGGSYGSAAGSARSAKRTIPSSTTNLMGFRIGRTVRLSAN